jgi:hypothetical protein
MLPVGTIYFCQQNFKGKVENAKKIDLTPKRPEAGVNLRVIQRYMGHAQLETTMVYLHLTQKGQEDACLLINQLMEGLDHDHNQ